MAFHRLIFSFLFLLSTATYAAIPNSKLVGSTSGSFNVTPSGAASYNVPIQLPPAVGGIQPQLSFNYNSSGGNGALGIGWQLSGLSAISRCPTNLERDGFIDGVDFDDNDQYCLDGQRLVDIGGGVYRTELDDFSYITGSEAGFTVLTAAGITMKYGDAVNSRIKLKGQSSRTISWQLHSVSDPFGNNYTVEYENNSLSTGESHLKTIYMGNKNRTLSHVTFNYESRSDEISGHLLGAKYLISKRLASVKTYARDILTKEYVIRYGSGVPPFYTSYISTIQECDAQGDCLLENKFEREYDDVPEDTLLASSICSDGSRSYGVCNDSDNHKYIAYVDFNNDGVADVCYRSDNGISCIPNINGHFDTSERISTNICANGSKLYGTCNGTDNWLYISYVDVTGDGFIDICYRGDYGINCIPNAEVSNSTERFFDMSKRISTNICANGSKLYGTCNDSDNYKTIAYVDFTGDGLADICYRGDSGIRCIPNVNGSSFNTSAAISSSLCANGSRNYGQCNDNDNYDYISFIDFNGDGMVDVCYRSDSGINCVPNAANSYDQTKRFFDVFNMVSTNLCVQGSSNYGKCDNADNWLYISYADVTGDGLVDICYRGDYGINCIPNIGGSFDVNQRISTNICANGSANYGKCNDSDNYRYIYFLDMNQNGKSDLVYRSDAGYRIWLSTGSSFILTHESTLCANGSSSYGKCNDNNNYDYTSFADFNSDGIIDIAYRGDYGIYARTFGGNKQNKVTRFTRNGITTKVNYVPMTDSNVYQKDEQTNPNDTSFEIQPPTYVVSEVTTPDGVGGERETTYHYKGLRIDRFAQRTLGFSQMSVTDSKMGTISTTTYRQDYPYIGMIKSSETRLISGNKLLSESHNIADNSITDYSNNIIFPYIKSTVKTEYAYDNYIDNVSDKTVATTFNYNSSGVLTDHSIVTTGDGNTYSVTTSNTISNYYNNRRQGEISRAEVISDSSVTTSKFLVTDFSYDWVTGKLLKKVIAPSNANNSIRQVSTRKYDAFGNLIQHVTCNGNYVNNCSTSTAGARYILKAYDSNGLFETSATNALGHKSSAVYDARFGVITQSTDINGLTSTTEYDSLGRAISSTNAFGNMATTTREWSYYSYIYIGSNRAYSKITNQVSGGVTSVTYYDQFDREIRKQTQGFDGKLIYVDTEYDAFGRVKRTSTPYFNGDNFYWNTPVYDVLGRQTSVITPNVDGSYYTTSQIRYSGYFTSYIDVFGRSVNQEKNAIGKVISVYDKASGAMDYEFDSLGNLTKTTDPSGNQVTITYDVLGRKMSMNDPDLGIWSYEYNTFGELISQTDAKGQTTTINYDKLGRMISRTDSSGTASWQYDVGGSKGKGKLYQKTAHNGDYTRHTYNSNYGQLVSSVQKIGSRTFTTKNQYDSLGRINILTYPSTSAYSSGFKVKHEYNNLGYLTKVIDGINSKVYWQANKMTARGQISQATLGNSTKEYTTYSTANGWLKINQTNNGISTLRKFEYNYDEVGNLENRIDLNQNNLTENFTYDDLDRLKSSSITGGVFGSGSFNKSFNYDAIGNITYKSDVGNYSYCSNKPHAVCQAGNTTYAYDANGNMVKSAKGTDITTVGYTPFNKANSMKKGSSTVSFNYDADRQRNLKSSVTDGVNTSTYYVGINGVGAKVFEQEVNSSTGTKDIHYIYGGGKVIATHITEGTAKKTEYLHYDHLGSASLITNDSGLVKTKVSFDAWGKRRNMNFSDFNNPSSLPKITGNIGFTGHESITEMGLIHMNGRIYDPIIGQFLSADPIVQAPHNSQSYNRYSYVMNNPLGLTDPSGYSWIKKPHRFTNSIRRKVDNLNPDYRSYKATSNFGLRTHFQIHNKISANVGIVRNVDHYVATHRWASAAVTVIATWYGGPIGAAAASAHIANAQGANINDIRTAAQSSFAMSMISPGVSEAAGGYLSNIGMGKFASSVVIGGTISALSGGSFKNGAFGAAISYGLQSLASNNKGYLSKQADGAGSSDGDVLPKEIRIALKAALDAKDYDIAINIGAEHLGLDFSSAKSIMVNKGLLGSYGTTDPSANIVIGNIGVSSPEAFISTLGHEHVHLMQIKNGTYSLKGQQGIMNEIEAHRWEINNVSRTGFTGGYRFNVKHVAELMNGLEDANYYQIIGGRYDAVK